MNTADYVPSPRARINNLVQAHIRNTGARPGMVWAKLYEAYEHHTNQPIRKMAYNNGYSPLDYIHALRKVDDFLEFTRAFLGVKAQPELVEAAR